MSRLLLVNAPHSAYSPPASFVPPLGLARIAAAASVAVDVRVVDMGIDLAVGVDAWSELRRALVEFDPAVVGIGPLVSANVRKGQDVARYVKSVLPGSVVLLGGPDPSAAPTRRLNESDGCVDAVIVGEAEAAIVEILDCLAGSGVWSDVSGVVQAGNVFRTDVPPARLTEEQFAELSGPAWSLFPLDRYKQLARKNGITPYLPLEMGRGCPYGCDFCSSHVLYGRELRFRPISRILDEIHNGISVHGYTRFVFNDDNTGVVVSRLVDFAQAVIERNWGPIDFAVSLRPDSGVFDDNAALEILAAAGVREVFLGCETENAELIKMLNKTTHHDDWRSCIVRAVTSCRSAGIACRTNWMIGLPGQSEQMFLATIEFIRELRPDTCLLSALQPYPGTRFGDREVGRFGPDGFRQLSDNPADFVAGKHVPTADTRWLERDRIIELTSRFLDEVGAATATDVSGSPYYLFELWREKRGCSDNRKT